MSPHPSLAATHAIAPLGETQDCFVPFQCLAWSGHQELFVEGMMGHCEYCSASAALPCSLWCLFFLRRPPCVCHRQGSSPLSKLLSPTRKFPLLFVRGLSPLPVSSLALSLEEQLAPAVEERVRWCHHNAEETRKGSYQQ